MFKIATIGLALAALALPGAALAGQYPPPSKPSNEGGERKSVLLMVFLKIVMRKPVVRAAGGFPVPGSGPFQSKA